MSMANTSQKKLALLDAFAAMYSSRIQIAREDYGARYIKVATVATVPIHGRIVPDMTVEYLERDQFLNRVNISMGGVPGAMAMIDGADDDEVPFGLIFDDGDTLMMRMRVARLDRHD